MTDLSKLGLQPAADHPDTELFELLELERRQIAAWKESYIQADATAVVCTSESIARLRPATLLGLLEKSEHALQAWRESGRGMTTVFSGQAAALEQAVEVLALFTEEEVAARRARG